MFDIIKKIIAFCITKGLIIFILVIGAAQLLKWYINEYNATGDPTGLLIIAGFVGFFILLEKISKHFEKK